MSNITPHKLLTLGLQKGFGGDTNMTKGERAGFAITASHFEDTIDGQQAVYHDEWAASRTGGGQELVRVGDQQYTRVYAGGTISHEAMARMGTSEADVMAFLMKMIQQLGDATRLTQDCPAVLDGDWQYQYMVKEQLDEIPMTVGREVIKFKGELVFVHWFLMTEVG